MQEHDPDLQDPTLGSNQYYNAWRVKQTVHEMMEQRGLTITDSNWKCDSTSMCNCSNPPTIRSFIGCKVNTFNITAENDTSKIFVHHLRPFQKKKIPAESVTDILQMLPIRRYTSVILIISADPSPNLSKTLYEFSKCTKIRVEIFKGLELMFNVTKHESVPRHEKLSSQEKSALFDSYSIDSKNLMLISPGDPVSRFYGFLPGDVIKIYRISETTGQSVTYRLVKKVHI
jgi:DNA-directed RNA polymerases I, II, and III subunit RPABC1